MEKKNEAPAVEKQPAIDVHKLNVYQKLILARKRFLERNVKKSGVNRQLEFQYFELQDIVPSATRIFQNVGLVGIVKFVPTVQSNEEVPIVPAAPIATMTVVNVDAPDEHIDFFLPYREVEQIKSKSGNTVTNPLQALGSSVTYLRRYLWMLAMDIVEQDDVDATLGAQEQPTTPQPKSTPTPAAPAPKKSAKPATKAERENIKVALTRADDAADELMVKGLKAALNALRQKDDKQDEFVQQVAEITKGFTAISRSQCEELTKKVNSMIEEYDKK